MIAIALAGVARSDGGAMLCSDRASRLRITLFAAPIPLTAGTANLSVMIQRADGTPILGAKVTLEMLAPDARRRIVAHPVRANAADRLLYAAQVDFPSAGAWSIHALVETDGATAAIDCPLPIDPASRLRALWWSLVPVPAVLIIFALHQMLAYRQHSDGSGTV